MPANIVSRWMLLVIIHWKCSTVVIMEILLVEDSQSFTGFENVQSFMAVEHGSRILVCHRFATLYRTLFLFFLVYIKCYS